MTTEQNSTLERDPATGEQYDPTTMVAVLQLRPPFTGFAYDHLRSALTRVPHEDAALLDNVLTRIEAELDEPHNFHRFHVPQPVTIPLLTTPEVNALRDAFAVPEHVCTAGMCAALRTQLTSRE